MNKLKFIQHVTKATARAWTVANRGYPKEIAPQATDRMLVWPQRVKAGKIDIA